MSPPRIRPAIGTAFAVAAVTFTSGVLSAAPPEPPPVGDKARKEEPISDAAKEYLQAATKFVEGIEVEVLTDGKWARVKRIEQPLLLYGDLTREDDRGSVWGWGEQGRPVTLLELYQKVNDRRTWKVGICNTSGGKLRASRAGAPWWQENNSGVELRPIPNAPTVAAEAAQQQQQVKLLARKFTGHEFWNPNNTRYELRRLERPLHTYRDEARGLLAGGLFTLANGTNPELMLFVEARAKEGSKPVWQFAVGRLADAPLHLEYDGKEVFTAPMADLFLEPEKSYWTDSIVVPRTKK
ncbi:hypothetical protein [Fimbriiglobus ruber]|uniref:Uncharacterized protein n=1 Tax=Fimbriiglobus ruber TaxID=1908690 RepID=A0A225E0L0_9BACT|nr:hypothetical protein [Fimbriiglobus ruber]OWK43029.1 hypothetical protein FRUB_02628 [Fimbriiglobus ruber]